MIEMTLTPAEVDRAAGVLVGQACGDALGVPYELGMRPLPPADEPAVMAGGGLGGYAKGEYSDDTQMAVCIGRAAARAGADLTGEDSLDEVAEGFLAWQRDGASDIGAQTASVLSRARSASAGGPARRLHDAAAAYARSHPGRRETERLCAPPLSHCSTSVIPQRSPTPPAESPS